MKFSLPDSISNLLRTAAKLDPTAKPFVPERRENDEVGHLECNPNFIIYNDGVPSCVPQSLNDILVGIDDDALNENFSPDAKDVSEMETIDYYVSVLAEIDILEDREERARNGFHHVRKRWESRRAHGLSPTKAPRKVLSSVFPASDTITNMIIARSHEDLNMKTRLKPSRILKPSRLAKSRFPYRGHKLIQQPRKLY